MHSEQPAYSEEKHIPSVSEVVQKILTYRDQKCWCVTRDHDIILSCLLQTEVRHISSFAGMCIAV